MELIYDDGWSTYEDARHLRIWQNEDKFFVQFSGCSPMMCPSCYEDEPYEVTYDQAIEEMLEMEESITWAEEYMSN